MGSFFVNLENSGRGGGALALFPFHRESNFNVLIINKFSQAHQLKMSIYIQPQLLLCAVFAAIALSMQL